MSDPAATPLILNTAGEPEREARTRQFNLLEACGMMILVLVSLWPLSFYLGRIVGIGWAQELSTVILGLGVVYIVFISPWVHRDTLSSWGLGNPRTVIRLLTTGPWGKRAAFALLLLGIYAVLNAANLILWPEVAEFLNLDKLAESLELNTDPLRWHEQMPGMLGVLLFGACVSLFLIAYAVRFDNFGSAFVKAMQIALPIALLICAAAFVQRGTAAFADFNPREFFLDVFGYVFWGFTQQLLFSGYFGTRFRMAFGPSHDPKNATPEDRWRLALWCAPIGGISVTAAIFLGLRWVYPASDVPLQIVFYTFPFMAGLSAVFGYAYALDRKRMLVAVLSASCFGLIHIDSYLLVAGTWMLGTILVYVFMEDTNRNLVALGFIHGLNGSTFGWLFSSGKSGSLEVDYSVGPYGMDDATLGVIWIPLICIAAYIAIAVYFYPRLENPMPPQRRVEA